MLITKFNALIRNRFVWGFFAVLVSVTMVGFFTDIEGCVRKKQVPDSIGALGGEQISNRALQAAKFNVILRLRMATGREFRMTPEMDKLVVREAWKRLALLQLANADKLDTSNAEIVFAVQRDPMFQVNGAFSKERYAQFLQILAQNYAIAPAQFEEYMREELTLDKIRRIVSAGAWTAPFEIERLVQNFADSFTITYTETPQTALTRGVSVTEAETRAFYDTHTAEFTIPDKVQVAYVAFPYSEYDVTTNITPEVVSNYYGDHLNDYFTTNSTGEPVARKMEEVESQIRARLSDESRREKAFDEAARFSDSLYDRGGQTNFFYAAASATGKTVRLTRFFSAREPLPELGVGAEFHSAAFGMSPEKGSNFSEPVPGSNAVYVIAYEGIQPSRTPPYEEVRDEAHAYALAEARNRVLAEKTVSLSRKVQAAVKSGSSFEDAVKAAELTGECKTLAPFTAYTAPDALDNARLITAVISLQQGEVTDLIPTGRGTLFVALIKARKPGDTTASDPLRNQIRSSLNRRHSQLLVSQWEEDLLKQKGYKEPEKQTDPQEEEEEDARTPPGPARL